MTVIRHALLGLLLTVLLASCDTGGPTDSTEAAPTGSPPVEGSGPETPRSTDDQIAITAPGLPVGGGRPDTSQDAQCAVVELLTEIPAGMSITVTNIRFTDDGIFTTNGEGCEDIDPCSGFTFTEERTECSVLVYATARDGDATNLRLDGVIHCAKENARTCEDFTWDEGSVSVKQPFEVTPDSSESSSEESTTSDTTGASTPPETTG